MDTLYIVTVDVDLGAEPPPLDNFCDFAPKKKRFLRHFNRSSHVLKYCESLNC